MPNTTVELAPLEAAQNPWTIKRFMQGLRSPTRWQGRVFKRRFHRAGLRPHRMALESGHLHVWAGGKGEQTLVLLHGFGGSSLWQWADMLKPLARRFRLLVPDLLWFGESDGADLPRTIECQAQAIRTLLLQQGDHPVHVAGVSYGGFIGYLLANDHPELLRSLTLIDCPASIMEKADYDALLERFDLPDMSTMLVPQDPSEIPRLLRLAYHRPPQVPRFALGDAFTTLFGDYREERRALLEDLVSYLDEPRESGASHHPTLILWGEHDRLFPLELAHRLKDYLGARAQVQVIPDTAHAPIVEKPRAVSKALLQFLASLD